MYPNIFLITYLDKSSYIKVHFLAYGTYQLIFYNNRFINFKNKQLWKQTIL